MMKQYYVDVRIIVEADDADEAAHEVNDAVGYAVHSAGFRLTGFHHVRDTDMKEDK